MKADLAVADERRLPALVRGRAGLTVLTGGQTGVDTLAARAALAAGLPVHLIFPKGYRQEDGCLTAARRRALRGASMHALSSTSFRYRTWTLVYLCDAVILLDPAGGAGCAETASAARRLGRPLLAPATATWPVEGADVAAWLDQSGCRVLAVAGCRASLLAGCRTDLLAGRGTGPLAGCGTGLLAGGQSNRRCPDQRRDQPLGQLADRLADQLGAIIAAAAGRHSRLLALAGDIG